MLSHQERINLTSSGCPFLLHTNRRASLATEHWEAENLIAALERSDLHRRENYAYRCLPWSGIEAVINKTSIEVINVRSIGYGDLRTYRKTKSRGPFIIWDV